ncbi:MAG: hypothetical protein K8S99_13420 [Planctomycetes bacterium]|nr:hypothetical protein [Planctomycetota bacterium]
MLDFSPPPLKNTSDAANPPRCMGCGYDLTGVEDVRTPDTRMLRCPECGRHFDPYDTATFTRKPRFVFWTYWAPAFVLAFVIGALLTVYFALTDNIGWGLALGVPITMGSVIGYGVRLRLIIRVLLGVSAILCVAALLISLHPAAIFCALILIAVFVLPLLLDVLIGGGLRFRLKKSRFSQRSHLPLIFFLLAPLGLDQLQKLTQPPPTVETVTTQVVLPLSAAQAWDNWVFYEEVRREPPLLLRLGLPQPVGTRGRIARVGDSKTCLYVHGRLVKRATAIVPGKRVAFDVVEQTHVEDHSVRLLRGSFDFAPVDAGHTRVTLTTEYVPLLTPWFCWRPVEALCVRTLHRHVLEGMMDRVSPAAAVAEAAP